MVTSPVLHDKEPVNPLAVNKELPQLSTTVTVGAEGIVLGEAEPLAGELAHPFAAVCVTV